MNICENCKHVKICKYSEKCNALSELDFIFEIKCKEKEENTYINSDYNYNNIINTNFDYIDVNSNNMSNKENNTANCVCCYFFDKQYGCCSIQDNSDVKRPLTKDKHAII